MTDECKREIMLKLMHCNNASEEKQSQAVA